MDPLAEKYNNWSPYSYVYNSPIAFIDPTGEKGVLVINFSSRAAAPIKYDGRGVTASYTVGIMIDLNKYELASFKSVSAGVSSGVWIEAGVSGSYYPEAEIADLKDIGFNLGAGFGAGGAVSGEIKFSINKDAENLKEFIGKIGGDVSIFGAGGGAVVYGDWSTTNINDQLSFSELSMGEFIEGFSNYLKENLNMNLSHDEARNYFYNLVYIYNQLSNPEEE